jgi:hypothetical protein
MPYDTGNQGLSAGTPVYHLLSPFFNHFVFTRLHEIQILVAVWLKVNGDGKGYLLCVNKSQNYENLQNVGIP